MPRLGSSGITKSSHLYAFCVNPNVTFEGQAEREKVILLIRAHPITFIPWIVVSGTLFIIPFILNIFLFGFLSNSEVIFINILWYAALYSYVFVNILSWLFNVGIVTNERVLDIDYNYILYKEVTGTIIDDVVDVTAQTSGFIRTFFRYGDVFVQTPGSNHNIEFLKVPQPGEVVSLINQLMENEDFKKEEPIE
jgi:hypothetical protein